MKTFNFLPSRIGKIPPASLFPKLSNFQMEKKALLTKYYGVEVDTDWKRRAVDEGGRGRQEVHDEPEFAESGMEVDVGEDSREHTAADSDASDSSSHSSADSAHTYSTDRESEDEVGILVSLEKEMSIWLVCME